jgi:hypothetical protein
MSYDTICLSGGGINCVSFIGCFLYFEEIKLFDINNIKTFYGTSAGSIICLFLILGYTAHEIYDFIINFNFNLLKIKFNIDYILKNNGFDNGHKLIKLLKYFIKNKLQVNDITFKELYDIKNVKFIINATNYSKNKEEIFSIDNTPDMSVILAIRISTSVPILFTPIYYNSNYYMDGALINNFQINKCNIKNTIGICACPSDIDTLIDNSINNSLLGIVGIIRRCISIIINSIYIKNKYDNVIIIKNTVVNGLTDYNISIDIKKKLIDHGRESAENYFRKIL